MTKKTALTLFLVGALVASAAPAFAGSVSFKFTKPENHSNSTVRINIYNGTTRVDSVPATIPPGVSAEKKRDLIKAALEAKGYTVTSTGTPPADPGITISGLTDGRDVYFKPGSTGEKRDHEEASSTAYGLISFEGTYNSTDWNGEPSTFTAGVLTDLGEAVVEYQASDFPAGDEIDGAYIAERLFADLLAAASDLGAWLELDGYQILVTYDPGVTEGHGGVIFGTTSPGDGLEAGSRVGTEVDAEPVPPLPPLP